MEPKKKLKQTEAEEYLNISRHTFNKLVRNGTLKFERSKIDGRVKLFPVEQLRKLKEEESR